MEKKHVRTAYLKMHLAIFLWGFTGLLGKLIELDQVVLVWYRMLISSAAILFILLYNKKFPKLSWRETLKIALIGIIVMLHWVTFYGSIKLASISVAMICLSSIALFASIFEPLVNKQKFDYVEILFSGLAVTGITTIYKSDVSASTGIFLGVFSALLSAIFSVFNKKITSKYESLTISFIELSSGFLFLSILLPFYSYSFPEITIKATVSDFIYLLILSLFCTVLTWILSLQALRKVSAFTMGLALNLEPVYGITLAILFAGESKHMNSGFITGAVIIFLTIILHTLYKFRFKRTISS
ncbi:MAG: DMT family transporter [Bacteroidia bacterium]